jgi:hypothetical protein
VGKVSESADKSVQGNLAAPDRAALRGHAAFSNQQSGPLAQVAAMMNGSPKVRALTQLKAEIDHSASTQGLAGRAAAMNSSAVGVPVTQLQTQQMNVTARPTGAAAVVQRVVPGFDDIKGPGDIPEDWAFAFFQDMLHQEAHLEKADIVSFVTRRMPGAMQGVWLTNRQNHWEVFFTDSLHPAIKTNADGNCAAHAAYAILLRDQVKQFTHFQAPQGFIQEFRSEAQQQVGPDEARQRIFSQLQNSSILPETGFGPRLMALLGPRAAEAQQKLAFGPIRFPSLSLGATPEKDPKKDVDKEKVEKFVGGYTRGGKQSFKMKKEGQRLRVNSTGSNILKEQLEKRKQTKRGKKANRNRQFMDLSYHETSSYIDQEFAVFWDEAEKEGLNVAEIQASYDQVLSKQTASRSGMDIESQGPSPLTTMTPELLGIYHDMHYKEELIKADETASTRAYEADYIKEVTTRLPFSQWRAFLLPESTTGAETTMVNAIGGSLDAQTATSGATIGQGKIYSTIYKHFQRSMELLNAHLDKEFGKYSSGDKEAFEKRTILHSKMLESTFLSGLYENEETTFSPESGFATWQDLRQTIDKLVILISASLDKAPSTFEEKFEILISLKELHKENDGYKFLKEFQLIGTIIGLMIKKEKRLILNWQMIGNKPKVAESLENLYQLARVEAEINKEVPDVHQRIGQLSRKQSENKTMSKDLRNLS